MSTATAARGRHLMEEHQQSGECHGGDCGGGEGLALGGHPGGDRAAGSGSGSGIILDDQGHVLTNTHVVTLGGQTNNPEISVRMDDGSVTSAEVVGTDPLSDLAVVQLEDAEGLTPAELGSSGGAERGGSDHSHRRSARAGGDRHRRHRLHAEPHDLRRLRRCRRGGDRGGPGGA